MIDNLEWYVLSVDFNTKKVTRQNIFFRNSIEEIIETLERKSEKTISSYKDISREDLKEAILSWARYYYWCRAEHEIMVGDLFSELSQLEKVDVYYQIEINIDRITDYVMSVMQEETKND